VFENKSFYPFPDKLLYSQFKSDRSGSLLDNLLRSLLESDCL